MILQKVYTLKYSCFRMIRDFFSIVRDIAASTEELNNDLINVNKWVYQWKMIFKPDLTKQAQEVIFSRKLNKPVHLNLTFNNSHASQNEH